MFGVRAIRTHSLHAAGKKKKEEFTSEGAALDWSRREKEQKSS